MDRIITRISTGFITSLVFLTGLSAQDDASFRLGLKAAPNFAWMRSDSKDLTSDGNRTGITYGLLGDFRLNEAATYFFSTGILLNNIGGKFKADATYEIDGVSTVVKSEQELKLRYVELPLALKLRTKTSGTFNFYGQFGVSTAFNVRARTDATTTSTANGITTTTSVDDEDVISDIALFKMALVVGAGVEYSLSSGPTLFGGVTFNNAFTNALDGDAKKLLPNDKKSKLFADYLEISLGVFL
ncbi:MAG: porin family protein [Flavobacteriales bacterium]